MTASTAVRPAYAIDGLSDAERDFLASFPGLDPAGTFPARRRRANGRLDADEYRCIFTANASAALRLVGESYPFAPAARSRRRSTTTTPSTASASSRDAEGRPSFYVPPELRSPTSTGTPSQRSDTMLATNPGDPIDTNAGMTARRRRRRIHPVTTPAPDGMLFTRVDHQPGTPGFARWTAALGQRIDADGLAAACRDLNNLIGVARRMAVVPPAVDVLADPTAPEPARLRAFAHVVSALVKPPARPAERCTPVP
jgi:hypothetical protein